MIRENLKSVYRDIAANSLPLTVGQTAAEHLSKRGLLWPELGVAMSLVELRGL